MSGPVIGNVDLLAVRQDVEGLRVEDGSKLRMDEAIAGVAERRITGANSLGGHV
jgi:hypothetical protein